MPKKFGVNSKAAEARARKEEQKQERRAVEETAQEDAKWVDDDKSIAAKQARQRAKEERKQQELQRKRELKEIEEAEAKANAKLAKKVRPEQPKVTRVQIQRTTEAAAKEAQAKALSADAPAFEPPPGLPIDADINPNHALRDEVQRYAEIGAEVVTADSIDAALDSLETSQPERHPEKRMGKAWRDYVEERYEALKAERPSLKRSQLLEILRDDWKKAPENPLNKDYTAYNSKG